jgi:hypothetical protein
MLTRYENIWKENPKQQLTPIIVPRVALEDDYGVG